ncbi:hypothetical protein [Gimesia chilikensis]|uniref:hypothetical protein n=1 Tax=Gimesia chilikensis TaxID=2605989 RepID=UPI003A958B7B
MAWPELSIEDFPPRRDDEPSSLRQDIIDELSDHFACALNRELLKNPNEKIARQRVLNQFGDPIKIARQLWLEAMKERIMSQRILTGVSVVMAACGFIVVGLVWSMMKESQAFNSRMISQMEEFADRPVPAAPPIKATDEMNQISFRLVEGKAGGKPAVGLTGKLTKIGNNTDSFTLEEVSGDDGRLNFGKLPWGGYTLRVKTHWDEYYYSEFTLIPGRNYSRTIVCPVSAPVDVSVRFEVEWPEQLKSDDWLLLCDFRAKSYSGGVSGMTRRYENDGWTRSYPNPLEGTWDYAQVCLIDQHNQVYNCPLDQNRRFKSVSLNELEKQTTVSMIEADEYLLPVMYLLRKQDLPKIFYLDSKPTYSYPVLNHSRNALLLFNPSRVGLQDGGFGMSGIEPPTTMILAFQDASYLNQIMGVDQEIKFASGIQLAKQLLFPAKKELENVWEIKIPQLNQLEIPEGVKPVESKDLGGYFEVPQGAPSGGQGLF